MRITDCRHLLLLWAVVILSGGFSPARAQNQDTPAPATGQPLEHSTTPQPDLARDCTAAGDSPVCAFKAWVACVLYDANGPCRAATDGRVEASGKPQTVDKAIAEAPWTLSYDRLLPEAYGFELFDDGIVPPDEKATGAAAAIPAGGAYQLIASETDINAVEWNFQISVMFAAVDGKWRVIGWSSARGEVCTGPSAAWPPCRLYLPRPVVRDSSRPLLWSTPPQEGLDPDQRPGVDRQMDVRGGNIAAPISGTVVRRPRVYFDSPLYRWVVIDGAGTSPPTMKLAFVSADGPKPGTRVSVTTIVGRQQALPFDDPNRAPFVHWEVTVAGKYVDPAGFLNATQ